MTPEGSEPLDELPKGEENDSTAPSSSSINKNSLIRVKNVSEINSNEAEANPSPPNKRKLPSWMLLSSQQPQAKNNKKIKTISNQVADTSTSRAGEEPTECIATHSTSVTVQDNTDCSDSTTNAECESGVAGEPRQNGEVISPVVNEADEAEATVAPIAAISNGQGPSTSAAAIKAEPDDDEDNEAVGVITPTSARYIKPAVKVEKEEATSSTTRPTCRFGIRCYRQNPTHRSEEAHPGDKDYKRPDFPAPPDGTPNCPYGDLCYRRNPVHFQQYSHPPSNFERNYKNYKMRLRDRKQPTNAPNSSHSDIDDDEDDYDLEDPFINDDSGDEFIPNSMDNEDDDDDFL